MTSNMLKIQCTQFVPIQAIKTNAYLFMPKVLGMQLEFCRIVSMFPGDHMRDCGMHVYICLKKKKKHN